MTPRLFSFSFGSSLQPVRMATKRSSPPLNQLEEMVNALPPAPLEKKSKKERKLKIKKPSPPPPLLLASPPPPPPPPPPPQTTSPPSSSSSSRVDDLFNGDLLHFLNPPTSSYPIQLPAMEQVCQPMNCPVCQTDLVCFQARQTGVEYVKCGNKQCGLFCHQDQLTTYLTIIDQTLHPDYRKRTLVCDCDEPVLLRISQSQTNPNRPYFTCQETPQDRCTFFQWADKPLKPKNQRKQRPDKS